MREYGEEIHFVCLEVQTWAMKQSICKDIFYCAVRPWTLSSDIYD